MGAILVLGLVVGAMVMFALERIPLEVSSLALITVLALSGVLTPEEAFSGIANDTVIFIFALLAMTQGLASTGVMQIVGRRMAFARRWGERPWLASLLATVAAFSSLASNTAVTAAFLPIASAAAARARIPRSRVLMPMAWSSMLGGMIFLYGTSTNLVVSEAMTRFGLAPLGFAELARVGLPVAALTIALLVLFSRRLVPERRGGERRQQPLGHRIFVTEAVVTPQSRLIGTPLDELAGAIDAEVIGMVRGKEWIRADRGDLKLQAGDRIVVRGSRRAMLRIKDLRSLVLEAELALDPRQAASHMLAEAFVPPHSPLVGRTLRELLFSTRFGLVALAIHRHPGAQAPAGPLSGLHDIGDVELAAGDVLLLSGPARRLRELEDGSFLEVLGSIDYRRPRYGKAALAALIFGTALAAAALDLLPSAIAGLVGLLAMIGTGCVDTQEAFRIEWRVVLLIGALLGLGTAMEKSGAGELLAQFLVPAAPYLGPRGLMFVVMALTVALSAPMSNQAAALVVLPIAIHLANLLGVEPRAFAVATCLAASCSFITPLEPSAALVFGPGRYRFVDFVRAGTPLTVLLLALFTVLVPIGWPL